MTTTHQAVTCLGCGCACDDIAVTTADGAITRIDRACALGRAWFEGASVPAACTVAGVAAGPEPALQAAARALLAAEGDLLVVLGPDLSTEAVRWALHAADRLRATVDTATSSAAGEGILAAQRRGRAGATLGEIRNRGDVVVFWGVDPAQRYPRYGERYAPGPPGVHVPEGRASRTVVSVTVGDDAGPEDADVHLGVAPADEVDVLAAMRAVVQGRAVDDLAEPLAGAAALAQRLMKASYAVLVHDGEPQAAARSPRRTEALITLVQALNTPTRAALSTLRAGGNANGAEAALTWQTGYPFAVDFADGHPRYAPGARGLDALAAGRFRAALVCGEWRGLAEPARAALAAIPTVLVGPAASTAPFPVAVAIDTGRAGIHEGGTAYRLDDVPLPLRPVLPHPRAADGVLASLACHLADPAFAGRS
ncbi:MAG: hypothetical protein NW201_02080 [Gemmatimonadales bacterium]|nr:hypothetical protein [Gemmatimonadales bacterium]